MRKGIKRIQIDLPASLYERIRVDADQRLKTIEEHVRDVLRSTIKVNRK